MNENNKIDVSLEEVTVNLSSIAPRKTVVHVEERDGKYAVITDDNTLLGVFNSTICGIESEFDAEIRSVRHPTHDHPVGHVVIRLRRKLQESRHPNGARQLLCEGLQQEEQLELLSQKQLEMLARNKNLTEVFQGKELMHWIKRVADASSMKEKECIVDQLLCDPEGSSLIDFVMEELGRMQPKETSMEVNEP